MTSDALIAEHIALETTELTAWASQPDRAVAYFAFPADEPASAGAKYRAEYQPLIAGAHVTTWRGTQIGSIIRARVYKVRSRTFSSRMIALAVRGSNGARYHGRASFDHGNAIQLRKAKR